jgi:hypothetical protein
MKIVTQNNNYLEFFAQIRQYFFNVKDTIHKARNEIKIINYNNQNLVVKSFKVPNLFNKIIYTFFKDSKAKKSYDNSIRLGEFVPKPIGYVEFTRFGLLHDSYFISEHFNYDFTIREPLLDMNFEDRVKIFEEFARFTFELHQNNILHLDYSPGNILIKKKDRYIFKVVDINRMKFKELSLDERLQNFAQLWAKDDDLKVMIKKYAQLANADEESCIKVALRYSQKHKDRKNFKKRLKGKKVVD